MMLDIDIPEIEEILDSYAISFSNLGARGRINYEDKTIKLSPLFSDCSQTLMHEVVHHYVDNVVFLDDRFSEFDIDELTKLLEEVPSMEGLELSSSVCAKEPYFVGDKDAAHKVAILDLGIKRNILKLLISFLLIFPKFL